MQVCYVQGGAGDVGEGCQHGVSAQAQPEPEGRNDSRAPQQRDGGFALGFESEEPVMLDSDRAFIAGIIVGILVAVVVFALDGRVF